MKRVRLQRLSRSPVGYVMLFAFKCGTGRFEWAIVYLLLSLRGWDRVINA